MHALAAQANSGPGPAVGFVIIIAAIIVYWIPTIIGGTRHVPNIGSIVIINLFAGWTVIGWIIAMAMAARSIPPGYGRAAPPLEPWRRQPPRGPQQPGGPQYPWPQQPQGPQPGAWNQPAGGQWNQPTAATPDPGPQPWPQQQSPSGTSAWDRPPPDLWSQPPTTPAQPPWDQPQPPAGPPKQP